MNAYIIQDLPSSFQEHPHGEEMQKSKMAVWGGLTNSPGAGKDGRQEEKGMTKDEMVGWHH